MSIATDSTRIFSRVVDSENGNLQPQLARFVLDLDFPEADRLRFEDLSLKAQDGKLTEEEANLLDGYLHVDSLLAILRLKAERSIHAEG